MELQFAYTCVHGQKRGGGGGDRIKVYGIRKCSHTIRTCSCKSYSSYILSISVRFFAALLWALAMSSSDKITHLLNLSTADSHALMEVITEYFAELDVDLEMDEEDVNMEAKKIVYYCSLSVVGASIVKRNYMYYRNKSKNNNNTLLTRHAVICTTYNRNIFRC